MTYYEAMKILDKLKDGQIYPQWIIDKALMMTGDLDEYSRKSIENPSDRVQLEQGEARMLYRTWETTQQRVLTAERMEYLEKRYGSGAVERIRTYMAMMKNGELT